MSDVILGRPPDPISFVLTPAVGKTPASLVIAWMDTILEQPWVGLFEAGKCWLANLTQANTGLVKLITPGDHAVTITCEPPVSANKWEADDAYCLQRQEDIWHFSKRETALGMLDPDDYLFGWTPANVWGVAQGPEALTADGMTTKIISMGGKDLIDSHAASGAFDVQIRVTDNAIVNVRRTGDKLCPWGTGDVRYPFRIEQRNLTLEEAVKISLKSLASQGDGFRAAAWQI